MKGRYKRRNQTSKCLTFFRLNDIIISTITDTESTLPNQEPSGAFKTLVSVLFIIGILALGILAISTAKSSGICDSSVNIPGMPGIYAYCTGYEYGENLNR